MQIINFSNLKGISKMVDEMLDENDPEMSLISDFYIYRSEAMSIGSIIDSKLKVYNSINEFPMELIILLKDRLEIVFYRYENLRDRLLVSIYSTNEKLNDIFKCDENCLSVYWIYAEKLNKLHEKLSFYDFIRDLLYYMRIIVRERQQS